MIKNLVLMGFVLISLFLSGCTGNQREILVSKEVSAEGATISLPDNSFTVKIPEKTFSSTQKVEIAKPSQTPKPQIGKVLVSYELLCNADFFNKPVVIEFNVTELEKVSKSNKTLAEKYVVAYYDEIGKVYVEVPFEVNSAEKKIVVKTDHFSLWALIGVEDYVVATSPHFTIRFYDSSQAAGLGARDIYGYVAKVRELLEEAYAIYVKAGFTPPKDKISVYVIDAEESHYTPFTGNIIISTKSYSDNATKHEIAHELFHLFQNQEMNIFRMSMQRWWIEATADYAADKIAFKTGEMGSGIKKNYYELPLSTVDGNHEYATAFFVDWLVRGGIPFNSLWKAVKERYAIVGVEKALDEYLAKSQRTSLLTEYSRFIDFILFNNNSPIKGAASEMVSTPVHFSAEGGSKNINVKIDKPYSSKVVGITCEVPKELKTRDLVIIATSGIDSQVSVRVYLLEGNERGKEKLIGTINAVNRPAMVKVSEKDAVYIVASSEKAGEIAFNITAKAVKSQSVPISFSETYSVGKNSLRVNIEGSIAGPIEASSLGKAHSYFGNSLDAKIVVSSALIPTQIELTPKHEFSLGTTWREETSNGYVTYKISNVRYTVTYYEIGADCKVLPSKETTFTKSWTYSTVTIDTSKCQGGFYQILLAKIGIRWDYSYEVVELRGGVEKVVDKKSDSDGRLIAEIVVNSIS